MTVEAAVGVSVGVITAAVTVLVGDDEGVLLAGGVVQPTTPNTTATTTHNLFMVLFILLGFISFETGDKKRYLIVRHPDFWMPHEL